jgi:1A family penicillin-binding protein
MTGFLFAWYAKDLPRPDKVQRITGLSTVIVDRNGEKLYDIYEDENRILAKWENLPLYLRQATVAIEDKNFYHHTGLSTTGIVRAVINIFIFHNFQGGSTLTQQLVKNALLTQEQTLPRKIKEAILAIQIERKYKKDEILQMYLNETPYGGTAVGAEAAAQQYFDKPVNELTLVESVIIAGLAQSPSLYSPYGRDPQAYIWRSQQVLRRMREDGYITPIQETQASQALSKVKFATGEGGLRAPHFVAYVREQLVDQFGGEALETGGLTVTTSLDWKLQEKAQSIVLDEVTKAKNLKVSNGAAVVINPNSGEILAMVGSKDYSATDSGGYKYNVATQGLRQPGSSVKPFTYAAALKKGYTASTVLMDVDTKYPSGDSTKPEYNPKNYDSKYRGPLQLRYALANSINTIAVKVSALVGVPEVMKLGFEMGLPTFEPTAETLKRVGLSLTLGGGEVTLLDLTSAFGSFATGGLHEEPVSILKVTDAKGKVLFEHKEVSPKRALSAEIAYIISSILSDNDARKIVFGPNSLLNVPGKTVAVKTGTTDDKRDNWTVGYTKSVVVGTWVGNNDNSPMNPVLASGVTGAAPIWSKIIKEALKDKKNEPFDKPDGVVEMDIDAYGGGLPMDGSATRKEFFVKGTEPTGPSPIYKKIKVSRKDANKLANDIEVAAGDYDTKTFIVFTEVDTVSTDGKNRWQEGIDEWIKSQSDSKFHPPTESQNTGGQLAVFVTSPKEHERIDNTLVTVKAEGKGGDISKMEVFVDGTLTKDASGGSIEATISVPNGIHTLRFKATSNDGHTGDKEIHIAINQDYADPTPKPTP